MGISVSMYITSILKEKRTFFERVVRRENLIQRAIHFQDIYSKFKEAGISGIELVVKSHTTDDQIAQVSKILEENNMTVMSIHQPLSKIFRINIMDIKRLFAIAKQLRAKIVVIHILALGKNIYKKEFISELKRLEKNYQIQIALENTTKNILSYKKFHVWREKEFTQLIDSIDFKVTMDVTHIGQSNGDILSFFKENKDRILNIHLSDFKKSRYQSEHLPLGRGILPVSSLVTLLKNAGYNNLITFEIDSTFESILASADALNKMLR